MKPHVSLLLFALTVSTGVSQPRSPGQGAVTGHVYCSDTHTPCRFASVILQPAQTVDHAEAIGPNKMAENDWKALDSSSFSAATWIDGSFQISGVAPGDYYVHSAFVGYLDPYNLALSGALDSPVQSLEIIKKTVPRVTVAAGKTTSTDLTLLRGASLEGTIRFDDGGFAYWVAIRLYRKDSVGSWNKYGDGRVGGIRFDKTWNTDDRGHFAIGGLVPGTYAVEATLPEPHNLGGLGIGLGTGGANSLAVYNGDNFKLKDAVPIQLIEGEDRPDVDITIPTTALHSLEGTVTANPDGRAVTKGTIRLLDPEDKTVLRETDIGKDGSFKFNLVLSGTYVVQVEALAEGGGRQSASQYKTLTAQLLVEGDISDLNYTVSTVSVGR